MQSEDDKSRASPGGSTRSFGKKMCEVSFGKKMCEVSSEMTNGKFFSPGRQECPN